jgi:membrane protease YdiL (CAAX protease family)
MVTAAAVAVSIVTVDMVMASQGSVTFLSRVALSCGAAVAYGWLAGWRWRSLGLSARPEQGWGTWVKVTAKVGAVIALLFGAVVVAAWASTRVEGGQPSRWAAVTFPTPSDFWPWMRHACVPTPIAEEGIYRLALCVPFAALIGPRWTIVVSGCVFAALHAAYGNLGVDNAVAGFILGWAFLKSRSLLVPIAWHSLGNLLVGVTRLAVTVILAEHGVT